MRNAEIADAFEELASLYELDGAVEVRVTDDGMMLVLNNGSTAAEIPAKPLADEAPRRTDCSRPSGYASSRDCDVSLLAWPGGQCVSRIPASSARRGAGASSHGVGSSG